MRRGHCIDCDHETRRHEIAMNTPQRGICLVEGCECRGPGYPTPDELWTEIERLSAPIPMIIFCPNPKCGMQHIDRPDPEVAELAELRRKNDLCSLGDRPQSPGVADLRRLMELEELEPKMWKNPDHRSHTCREDDGGCGMVFRLADVLTTGVADTQTRGKADTFRIDERQA